MIGQVRCAVLLLAALGCGRFGYGAAERDADAAPDGDAAPLDATPLGPFGEATVIADLVDPAAADDDPSMTGDLLELYFKSDRDGMNDPDIWLARRSSPEGAWDEVAEVAELSSNSFDGTPEVSVDGLTITLSSDRPGGGGGGIDLWVSTRLSRADPWDPPVPMTGLNSADAEYAAVTNQSGDLVIFNRTVPSQSFDLLQSMLTGDTWSPAVPLVNLSSAVYEADSHLDPTGRELYFAGELADAAGRDLYVARRDEVGLDFAPPERVVELSTPMADEDPWVSPDRRLIIFSSDRSGDQEIYSAVR